MDNNNVVVVDSVVKSYDGTTAVDNISFSIPNGAIYGLLGPNGAGKTTTIRMLMRILLPDSGTIAMFGQLLDKVEKPRIGYLPEERGLYKKMNVVDLLTFFGQVKRVERKTSRARALQWLERVQLSDCAEKKVEELSKGMQQKVQFVTTVLHEPDILILDEPFAGLDPVNTNLLKDIILDYHHKGHTVIFSTHMMDQVEKLCDNICLISKGRIVLEGTLDAVKREYGLDGVTLRFEGDGAFLADLDAVASYNDYGNEVFLRLVPGADAATVLDDARKRLVVKKFEVAAPSIHDIFIEKVSSR
jgi:ABC-2 type transport system ATP-binding protein